MSKSGLIYPLLTEEELANNVSFKKYLFSLLIAAAVALLGVFDLSAYYFGAIVIAFIGISWGVSCAAIPGVVCCVCIIASGVSDLYSLFCFLIPFILTIVILTVGFKQRMAHRSITILLALMFVVALYAGLCLPSVMNGEPAYAGIREGLIELDEQLRVLMGEETTEFASMAEIIGDVLYFVLIAAAEAMAFFAVVIMKRLCSAAKASVRPMARLADWELPKSLRYGIPVLAVGCIVLSLTGFYAAEQVVTAVCGLILPLLFIEGFASVMFLLTTNIRVSGGKRNNKTLVMIFMLLMAMLLPAIYIIAGIIELYARRRPKLRRINEKIMKAFEDAVSNNRDIVEVDFEDGRGPQIIATRKHRNDAEIFFDDDLKLEDDTDDSANADDSDKSTDSTEHQAPDDHRDDHEEDKQ